MREAVAVVEGAVTVMEEEAGGGRFRESSACWRSNGTEIPPPVFAPKSPLESTNYRNKIPRNTAGSEKYT
ncbi:hypothetical protein NL676_024904 [Syzygium grande]|nr:hypothetical protein NL676_024904 [Syzygium grande]